MHDGRLAVFLPENYDMFRNKCRKKWFERKKSWPDQFDEDDLGCANDFNVDHKSAWVETNLASSI